MLGFRLRHGEQMHEKGEIGRFGHGGEVDAHIRNIGGALLRRWRLPMRR